MRCIKSRSSLSVKPIMSENTGSWDMSLAKSSSSLPFGCTGSDKDAAKGTSRCGVSDHFQHGGPFRPVFFSVVGLTLNRPHTCIIVIDQKTEPASDGIRKTVEAFRQIVTDRALCIQAKTDQLCRDGARIVSFECQKSTAPQGC